MNPHGDGVGSVFDAAIVHAAIIRLQISRNDCRIIPYRSLEKGIVVAHLLAKKIAVQCWAELDR